MNRWPGEGSYSASALVGRGEGLRIPEATRDRQAPGRLRSSAGFLREVIRNPRSVGAIAPTSRRLAEAIVQISGVSEASKIIELGPGTGAITEQIFRAKHPRARVLAIERNPEFSSLLETRFPDLQVICGCASGLGEYAAAHDFEGTDAIVSALPWTIFDGRTQRDVLDMAMALLDPGGVFTTIACVGLNLTAKGRNFRKLLNGSFAEVQALPAAWFNLPPAFVYRCVKAGSSTAR